MLQKTKRITLSQRKSCGRCGPESVGSIARVGRSRGRDVFLEFRIKVRLLSLSEMVKSAKDEFPADGDSICHG